MLTLAIETATKTAGMAILKDEEVLAEFYVNLGRHHAEVLLPALEQLFLITGLAPERIDLFACTVGPGSFTGVRIGVSTVKGLVLATGKPVAGVSTLEALALNAALYPNLICPLLDAQKGQVYAGIFRVGDGGFSEAVKPERLSDVKDLLRELDGEEAVFLGDGAVRYAKLIGGTLPGASIPVNGRLHRLQASAVGLAGLRKYRGGGALDALTLAPKYLRLSEAETKYRAA